MRAVLVKDGKGPLTNLYIGETATPKPADGEVLVKVGGPLRASNLLESHCLRHRSDQGIWSKSVGHNAT